MFAHKFALRAVKNLRDLSSNRSMSTLLVRRRFSCFGSVEPFNQDLINWRHHRRQFGSSAPSNSTDNKEQYKSVDDMINDDAEIRLNNLDLANYNDHGPKSLEDKELDEQNDEEEQQEADDNNKEQTWVTKLTPYALQYGPRVVVASGLAYGFTKISLYITTQLMSITLTDAVWFGFGSGFVVAAATAVSAVATWNTFDSVRPEPVYREALNKIRENEEILRILGPIGFQSKFESGFMRSYKLDGGSLGFGPGLRGFAVNVGRGPETVVHD